MRFATNAFRLAPEFRETAIGGRPYEVGLSQGLCAALRTAASVSHAPDKAFFTYCVLALYDAADAMEPYGRVELGDNLVAECYVSELISGGDPIGLPCVSFLHHTRIIAALQSEAPLTDEFWVDRLLNRIELGIFLEQNQANGS